MAIENLPEPRSPLPKRRGDPALSQNPSDLMTQREMNDLYQEVVSLRQTLNAVLTHLKTPETP